MEYSPFAQIQHADEFKLFFTQINISTVPNQHIAWDFVKQREDLAVAPMLQKIKTNVVHSDLAVCILSST